MRWKFGFIGIWTLLFCGSVALLLMNGGARAVDTPVAHLTVHQGIVLFRDPALATWTEAQDGQGFSRATVVATLGSAKATLLFLNGKSLELDGDSQLELSYEDDAQDGDIDLNLIHGRFLFVPSRKSAPRTLWGGISAAEGFKIRMGGETKRYDADEVEALSAVSYQHHATPAPTIAPTSAPMLAPTSDPIVVSDRITATVAPPGLHKSEDKSRKSVVTAAPLSESFRTIRLAIFERDGTGGLVSSGLADLGWSEIHGVAVIEIPTARLERRVKGIQPWTNPGLFFSQIFELIHTDLVLIVGSPGEDVLVMSRDSNKEMVLRRVAMNLQDVPAWLKEERLRIMRLER